MFAVYKEVEDYYFGEEGEGLRGFKELEDVTLLLCDDNFGNMRTLPEQFEKKSSRWVWNVLSFGLSRGSDFL